MKKSTFKKVLCIVLMSLMLLSLVACGGGRDTDTESEGPSTATVVYDTQGGTLPAGKEDTVEYDVGKKLLLLPTPTKEGYEFAGWTLNGEAVATPFIVEEDVVFTATWTKVGGGDNTDSGNSNVSSDTNTETETEDTRPKVTISLVLNGGTIADGEAEEFEAVVGEKLYSLLPKSPTKAGYTFLGWYEDGKEIYEIDKKTKVEDYDMEIHALWEAKGEMVTVEFFLNADETLEEGAAVYFEMVAGEMVGSFVDKLPNATKDGNKFVGWQDENGVRVSLTTRITSNTRLSPVWTRIILCHDGTENHQWNAWQEYSQVTCTTPAQEQRVCNLCGASEFNETQPAKGHAFGEWKTIAQTEPGKTEKGHQTDIPTGFARSRECLNCDVKEATPLTNIAYEAFNPPEIEGTGWGMDLSGNLINGKYDDCPFCGDGKSAVIVTLTAKDAVYVDVFAVTGWGAGAYEVTAYFKDGTSKGIGMGSFGGTSSFNIGKEVVKFEINMESPSNGTDFWSELTVLVIPTDEE